MQSVLFLTFVDNLSRRTTLNFQTQVDGTIYHGNMGKENTNRKRTFSQGTEIGRRFNHPTLWNNSIREALAEALCVKRHQEYKQDMTVAIITIVVGTHGIAPKSFKYN